MQVNQSEKNCCDNCSCNCQMEEEKDKLHELLNFCSSKDYKISDFINVTEEEKITHRSTIISKAISKEYLNAANIKVPSNIIWYGLVIP